MPGWDDPFQLHGGVHYEDGYAHAHVKMTDQLFQDVMTAFPA